MDDSLLLRCLKRTMLDVKVLMPASCLNQTGLQLTGVCPTATGMYGSSTRISLTAPGFSPAAIALGDSSIGPGETSTGGNETTIALHQTKGKKNNAQQYDL